MSKTNTIVKCFYISLANFPNTILCFFFFLMIRRPPRSTLFPYTDALPISPRRDAAPCQPPLQYQRRSRLPCRHLPRRSEEHTSELQSRENLVCRLLLEKKKNTSDGRNGSVMTRTAR